MDFKPSFRSELSMKHADISLASLKETIQKHANAGHRNLKLDLEKQDYTWKLFSGYNMIGYGKALWDKLVELGFTPEFTAGGEWGGGPGIWIRW